MPIIDVEFFGLAKHRVGIDMAMVDASTIEEMFAALSKKVPEFGTKCLEKGQLVPELILSINGKKFTRDHTIALSEGDHVLILSTDAGG